MRVRNVKGAMATHTSRGGRDELMLNLLVVANHTVPCPALIETIVARTRSAPQHEVRVVAPALSTRLRHLFSDVDGATAAAQARLDRALAHLRVAGVQAAGGVGDS